MVVETPSSVDTRLPDELESYRVCFLDLDDTLIPTTWMRASYEKTARLRGALTNAIDPSVYRLVKKELDDAVAPGLGGEDFEDLVIDFIVALSAEFHTVAIVTNARSYTWLKTFKIIFAKLAAKLDELEIKIIKTLPRGAEPPWFTRPTEYFEYWASAKFTEFDKVLAQRDEDTSLQMICVGDNNFEHNAFIRLCEKHRPDFAQIIKCTCGLRPKSFVNQLIALARTTRLGPERLSPKTSFKSSILGSGLSRFSLEAPSRHVTSVAWSYEPVRTDEDHDEFDDEMDESVVPLPRSQAIAEELLLKALGRM